MPFVANTPESFIGRSDSLNPNATCRGITSNGRACRRPITAAESASPKPKRRPLTPDPSDESLYCWQHKEQASLSAHSSPGPRGTATPNLEGRTSIDTLADRLGLVDLQDKPKRKTGQARPANGSAGGGYKPAKTTRPKPAKKLHFCFCFSVPLEEIPENRPPRPQPRPMQRTSIPVPASRRSSMPQATSKPPRQRVDGSTASSGRNSHQPKKSSQTGQVKDLIPDSLDTPTASALMTEVARPFLNSEEPGFIYMFWLTPVSDSAPPVDAARSLLAPPSPAGGTRSRRPSDVVSRFANQSSATKDKTMVLKIGRAANVQRRMNQWQRQCGYDVEMLRYYPYLPGASESSGVVPHMTPHCHRVERLVHIELAGMGLRANKDNCEACGRDHREWFEVEATRDGVRKVDEVIRRWVEWDEANSS